MVTCHSKTVPVPVIGMFSLRFMKVINSVTISIYEVGMYIVKIVS
jgi:hypothetical protein